VSRIQHAQHALLAVALIAELASVAGAHPHPSSRDARKWWLQDSVKAALGLLDEQSERIEAVFQEALPELRVQTDRLREEEAHLSALLVAPDASETDVIMTIDRVERVRSALGKARTLMLFRMYRVLSPDQRARLELLSRPAPPEGPAPTVLPPH